MNLSLQQKKYLFIVAFALLLLGTLFWLLIPAGSGVNPATTNRDKTDSIEAGLGQEGVRYEGFAELASKGFTSFQMEGVRYALFQFAPKATKFRITPSTISQAGYDRDNPSPIVPVTFDLKIDDKAYKATVDKYMDLKTIRVYLRETSGGNPVYDSQPLDSHELKNPDDAKPENTRPGA